ncbi:unnamed protein product [Protopolystoma xenopodis]|uniref:Uncharacterized protein n=1 Tax=Protopolystoma xenopodis TaxID=117903 RepID=A0A3S5B5N3_9PLAT|nr:unnamed protein product [Protopolystoma xenopodis]
MGAHSAGRWSDVALVLGCRFRVSSSAERKKESCGSCRARWQAFEWLFANLEGGGEQMPVFNSSLRAPLFGHTQSHFRTIGSRDPMSGIFTDLLLDRSTANGPEAVSQFWLCSSMLG